MLINADFNIPGQPIVCDVIDAYRCFLRVDLDFLVVETFLLDKDEQ
jgi:carbamoyltransferase